VNQRPGRLESWASADFFPGDGSAKTYYLPKKCFKTYYYKKAVSSDKSSAIVLLDNGNLQNKGLRMLKLHIQNLKSDKCLIAVNFINILIPLFLPISFCHKSQS